MAIRTFELPTKCPTDPDKREVCGRCLRERLMATPGVRKAELKCADGQELATLELDYDPRLVPFNEIEREVERADVCFAEKRAAVVLGIEGMVSPRSEQVIEAALSKLPGVASSASYSSRTLRVEFDRRLCALPEIARRLDELGFRLRSEIEMRAELKAQAAQPGALSRYWLKITEHRELSMAIIGALLLIIAWIAAWKAVPAVRYPAVIACFVIAGWYTAINTFQILRQFQFDIDVLMFAAAFGAASLGHFEEGALLLVLFALGGAGEHYAMERARKAIEALAKLAPETATVRDAEGRERLLKVEDLKVGDHVVVRPFDRLPADGSVESGTSAIDQSPITGESVPVDKSPGSPVFAGTINGEGLLLVTVTKPATESTLAKIVKMVNEAQTTKSPTQVFTDKVERWYVPAVILATIALIVLPPIFLGGWSTWFYRAMAFLTAASPCALAIGTPAAVLSGIARAARIGVLVKGGVHLENLGRVSVVALDKTGTITTGRPAVTDVVALDGAGEDEVLALAASVESTSTHPLARAIVNEAISRGVKFADAPDAHQVAGQGVRATVNGRRVLAGRPEMVIANGDAAALNATVDRLIGQGKSIVAISIDDRVAAVIGLRDEPRKNAREALAKLKRVGIRRTIMLTGDKHAVAEAVARDLGVDEVHSDLLPEEKLELVRKLEKQYGLLAMVGDGVNDAPALASATVGIAMGGAGTDVAIETADVALMSDDLVKLSDAIGLSKFSRKIIKQNLTIALGVIAVLAPLAALGYTYLGVAVLFHEGSTVVVVLNSLRLLVWKPGK
jgi:Cd2+/Zn2+-exporting ATPase